LKKKKMELKKDGIFDGEEVNRITTTRGEHVDSNDKVDEAAEDITLKGAVMNAVLASSKFSVGLLANSPAMISDAAHSFADIVTDAVTIVSYKISRRDADFEFAYGYGKVER